MLRRLKRLPMSTARGLGRLASRLLKLALLATVVAGIVIALDAILLDEEPDTPESGNV